MQRKTFMALFVKSTHNISLDFGSLKLFEAVQGQWRPHSFCDSLHNEWHCGCSELVSQWEDWFY